MPPAFHTWRPLAELADPRFTDLRVRELCEQRLQDVFAEYPSDPVRHDRSMRKTCPPKQAVQRQRASARFDAMKVQAAAQWIQTL